MVIYKTSMLHIIFNESIICEDEVQPDEPKIPILESLIEKVTDLNNTITENEETRNNNENTRISNENERKTSEKERETYYTNIKNKVNNGEFNGATYLPNVDAEGNISWTNNKGLENPSSQNIRGSQGIQGIQGEKGIDGKDGINGTNGKNYSVEIVENTLTTQEIEPNKFYKFGEVTELNLTLAEITDNTQLNEFMFEFISGVTATTLTLPNAIKWPETPTIEANKIYQCSIVDNIGVLLGVSNV